MRSVGVQVLIGLACLIGGCGKYGPPFPPEALAPSAVGDLMVSGSPAGVTLAWSAPEQNQRKRELQSIDGYTIMRRDAATDRANDGAFNVPAYSEIGTILDTHLAVQDELREKARAEGKPASRIKVDPALKRFSFVDPTPVQGTTYMYKVVPFNQGGVAGGVRDEYRVVFNGANSVVTRIVPGGLGALGDVDPFDVDDESPQ